MRRAMSSVQASAAQDEQEADAAEQCGFGLGDDNDVQAACRKVALFAVPEVEGAARIPKSRVAPVDGEIAGDELVGAAVGIRPIPADQIGNGQVAECDFSIDADVEHS